VNSVIPASLARPAARQDRAVFALSVLACMAALSWAVYVYLPIGVDWLYTYQPASLRVLGLRSPYEIYIFHSPPWSLLPLLPIALLPARLGHALNFSLSIFVACYASWKLGAKPLNIFLIAFSYPVLFSAFYGNVDWLIWLGLILPARWGLFLLLVKPQNSIGLVFWQLVESWKQGGLRLVVYTFAPVTLALGLSFWAFGLWFMPGFSEIPKHFNTSLWPQGLPIGLALLASALQRRQPGLALASSPFFSPYLAPQGWGAAMLGLCNNTALLAAASAGIWILRILKGFTLQ
jgi:hypothetical protein